MNRRSWLVPKAEGRGPEDYGHVAYITTDGGTVELAPDGVLRPARLVRIEFAVEDGAPR